MEFLTQAKAILQLKQNHIWMVVHQTTEDASTHANNGLAVALCLLNMLPTLLANFTFNAAVPLLTSFALEVYASWPWLTLSSLDIMHTLPPHSDCMAIDILKNKIIHHFTAVIDSGQIPMSIPPTPPNSTDLDRQEKVDTGDGTTEQPSWVASTQHPLLGESSPITFTVPSFTSHMGQFFFLL